VQIPKCSRTISRSACRPKCATTTHVCRRSQRGVARGRQQPGHGRVRFGDRKPAGLRQNQQLTTRILIDEHPNVLMVDRGPFVDTGAGRVAYVVHGDVAERTPIQIGATSLNAVEIVSGLKEATRS